LFLLLSSLGGFNVRYRRGKEILEKEVWLMQLFAEYLSDTLCGTDKAGEDGMIKEWLDDRATRRAYHKGLQALVAVAAVLVVIEAVLNIIQVVKHF
jgi:hypothetical protein